ncbi:hypothetical protein FRB93_002610 [Tulasnella sp. JGI-2019a]|nr:hypothetical protein FRB93_002610 [Tulasnella sp. JGI-2019a]
MPSQGIVISLSLWDAKFIEAVGAKDLPVTHTPKLLVQFNELPISDVFYVIGMIQVFNVPKFLPSEWPSLGRSLPFLVTCFLNIAWLSGSGPLSGAPGQSSVFTSVLAMDANAERLFGWQPTLHQTTITLGIIVGLALLTSFVAYVRFCTLAIQDITEYLDFACFSVRKRDPAMGEWTMAHHLEAKKLP